MNRLKIRIKTFCEERAKDAIEVALLKAKDTKFDHLSKTSQDLLMEIAKSSIDSGETPDDAYKSMVDSVLGSDVSRISSDMRVPMIVAALFMNKEEWIHFHSTHMNEYISYISHATYYLSKAYITAYTKIVSENKKRQKAKKAEKSAINSSFEDLDYDN